MLICSAVLLVKPNKKVVLLAFVATLPINIGLQLIFLEMNYFVRAFWVIFSGLSLGIIGSKGRLNSLLSLFQPANKQSRNWGWALAISLLFLHFIFH